MSVVVIGSINSDLVLRVPRLPKPGETIKATSYETYPGGKGANQAVAATRMGAPTTLIGRVGRDGVGVDLIEELREAGVDVGGISGDMDENTGLALITVASGGENTIVTLGGANHTAGTEELHALELALVNARILLVQLEIPMDVVTTAVELARAEGVTVVLDPAPVQPLDDDLYAGLDWITPNEHEAEVLTGAADPAEAARILHDRGVRHVAVTVGSRGCRYLGPDGPLEVPAPAVDAVDTVACGDAFNGVLAARLHAGEPIAETLRWATVGGALAARRPGAFPSLPTREEVEAALTD